MKEDQFDKSFSLSKIEKGEKEIKKGENDYKKFSFSKTLNVLKIKPGLSKGTYRITFVGKSTSNTRVYEFVQTGKSITLIRFFDKRISTKLVNKKI